MTRILILAFVAIASAGCPSPRPVQPPPPLEPLISVVQGINANNSQLPTLWASHYFEATIVDDRGDPHFVNGDGAILYRGVEAAQGRGMLVAGLKPGAGRVFEIGSTEDEYWLKIAPEIQTMWWGEYRHLGKPCVQEIPIQPNLVSEVLGIGTIGTDFTQFPAPVMRYNPDSDVYMFVWIGPATSPARFVALKEIWYDRTTKLPKMVLLFNGDGRVQVRANLLNHKPVAVEDVPEAQRPQVATRYELYFPENRSKMTFDLKEVHLSKGPAPARGIVFPGPTPQEAGVAKVIKLDQNCAD